MFATEDEAKDAMNDRNGEKIGPRWIELFQMSQSDFHAFEVIIERPEGSPPMMLSNYITPANKDRTVKL